MIYNFTELFTRAWSAVEALWLTLGAGGVILLCANIILAVKKANTEESKKQAIVNELEKYNINIKAINKDNKLIADMCLCIASKLGMSLEDFMAVVNKYKDIAAVNDSGESIAEEIIENVKEDNENKQTVAEEINTINSQLL